MQAVDLESVDQERGVMGDDTELNGYLIFVR